MAKHQRASAACARTVSAQLCVLASGSTGNCSILRTSQSTLLIDAGLSPRRTRQALAAIGLGLGDLDAILLTHLDSDHFHVGWPKALPATVPVFVHCSHTARARQRNLPRANTESFNRSFSPAADVSIQVVLNEHDDEGTAAFRIGFDDGATLGFATDLGRPTGHLVNTMQGVDVLAIESNYDPVMQLNADRPWFLKERVMGGCGHLSNEECQLLINQIKPRQHVVLLHLSRQCNDPALVCELHKACTYRLTISRHDEPTPWIPIYAAKPVSDQSTVESALNHVCVGVSAGKRKRKISTLYSHP